MNFEVFLLITLLCVICALFLTQCIHWIKSDYYDFEFEDCEIIEKSKKRKPTKGAIYE